MKIKIIAIAVLFVFASNYLVAQTSDAEAEALINLLGVQKREAMSKMVNIAAKDSAAFWKLYDEYNEKNKATGRQRMRLYERTAQAYGNMNDKIADSLSKVYFVNRVDQEKMLESYYQKIKVSHQRHYSIRILPGGSISSYIPSSPNHEANTDLW